MQNNSNLSVGEAASLLIGAGLTQLNTLTIGLTLIGVGVVLKVLIAWLQKRGLEVSSEVNNG